MDEKTETDEKTEINGKPEIIEKTDPDRKHVMVESRGQKFVTCPHCWTEQRTERNFCYCCEAGFLYLDEQSAESRNGQVPETSAASVK